MRASRSAVLGLAGAAAMLAGACSSTASPTPAASTAPSAAASAAAITVPDSVKAAGKLVVCSDISYPPEEFYAADGTTAQGSDIDIANELGKRFGVKTEVDNTNFDGIIAALVAKKCDVVLSGMNDTEERRKEVDFVDYMKAGQGLLVPKGNPKNIKTLDDLSGKSVAVQAGTTNADALAAKNAELEKAGKAKIDIQTFTRDTDGFQQLQLGRVDAFSTDSPVIAYYASLPGNSDKFEVGGSPIDPIPVGAAIRKDDAQMKTGVTQAFDAMYADGTMKAIFEKWGMTQSVVLLK